MTETLSSVSVAVEEAGTSAGSSPELPPVVPDPPKLADTPSVRLEDLRPGMKLAGKVVKLVRFGAFVDVGVGQDGLVHVSELEKEGLGNQIQEGHQLDVWVQHVDTKSKRLSLGLQNRTPLRDLKPGTVVDGRVVRMEKFGAFVDIGATSDGLVHLSNYPSGLSRGSSGEPKVGDQAKVKILSVEVDRRRISLSMRDDPEPSRAKPRPRRRPRPRPSKPAAAKPLVYEDPKDTLPTAMQIALEKAYQDEKD